MYRKLGMTIVLVIMAMGTAVAKEVIKEFQGTTTTTTEPFFVDSPWILDWRLDGDFDQLIALDITLVEARTGRHVGRVLHTKYKGNGVKLFYESGMYKLRISTTLGRWRVKIEQLTEEEAELYTPKRPPEKRF